MGQDTNNLSGEARVPLGHALDAQWITKRVEADRRAQTSLFVCLYKVGISTDKIVYLKRSYAKGKKKKREKEEK